MFSKLAVFVAIVPFIIAGNVPEQGTSGYSNCNSDAKPDGTCPLQTSQTTFTTSTCVPDPQRPGQYECGYVNSACSTDDQCQGNGSCLYPLHEETGGKCRGYFGDPCGDYLGCLGFMSCGTEVDFGALYPSCGGSGAFCTQDANCASGSCQDSKCTNPAARKVGDACSPVVSNLNGANGETWCGEGLECSDAGTCQTKVSKLRVKARRSAQLA